MTSTPRRHAPDKEVRRAQPARQLSGRLSDEVAEFLRTRIYSGDYKPGDRLLELDLCKELGISRTPLREALLSLQAEGLVEVRPHRGAKVTSFTKDDLAEITEVRAVLEGLAARKAAEGHESAHIRRLLQALGEMRQAAEAGDGVAAAVAHVEFHRSIALASENKRLVGLLDQIYVQSRALTGYAELSSDELIGLAASHTPLISVIESGDGDAAEQAVVAHIRDLSRPIREFLRMEMYAEGGDAAR